ncbi:hypothetical protein EVAR_60901_1 [Eumeta japonica]|uniref:THAP-type domain-containing protein n=1 Tax=Eumeta variegata TaxID=151549 RepID=A0A4C1ZJ33_EUMVA|nr:hypothetical protein EVAR_60901_1 [Eumeta japonica]
MKYIRIREKDNREDRDDEASPPRRVRGTIINTAGATTARRRRMAAERQRRAIDAPDNGNAAKRRIHFSPSPRPRRAAPRSGSPTHIVRSTLQLLSAPITRLLAERETDRIGRESRVRTETEPLPGMRGRYKRPLSPRVTSYTLILHRTRIWGNNNHKTRSKNATVARTRPAPAPGGAGGTPASRLSLARAPCRSSFRRISKVNMGGGKYCAFYGCMSKKTDKEVSFFKLPANEGRRKKWLDIIQRTDLIKPDLNPKSYVVCSKHFDKSSIIFTPKLKSDAVPSRIVLESKTCDQATQTKAPNKKSTQKESTQKQQDKRKSMAGNPVRRGAYAAARTNWSNPGCRPRAALTYDGSLIRHSTISEPVPLKTANRYSHYALLTFAKLKENKLVRFSQPAPRRLSPYTYEQGTSVSIDTPAHLSHLKQTQTTSQASIYFAYATETLPKTERASDNGPPKRQRRGAPANVFSSVRQRRRRPCTPFAAPRAPRPPPRDQLGRHYVPTTYPLVLVR